MPIWVDADATPRTVREILERAAMKRKIETIMVANRPLPLPRTHYIRTVLVVAGPDEADNHIAEHCGPGDLVITADIPLAARAVEKGAEVLRPRGGLLTKENVEEALSMRNFSDELRSSGVQTGGPKPFASKHRQQFANGLDRWITQHLNG